MAEKLGDHGESSGRLLTYSYCCVFALCSLVNDRYRLRELEDRSLTLLHSSSGNILDDEDLIKTLDDSKKMADAIQTRVLQSEETEEVINQNREKYMPVATRGAVLYFVLTDLASVDVMYQFSLPWFTRLFSNCIEASQETPSPRAESAIRPGSAGTLRPMRQAKLDPGPNRPGLKRRQTVARPKDEAFLPEYLQALVEILTENVYRVVSHALFARHQLTFSFMLCTGILRHAADSKTAGQRFIPESEWSWFLRGSAVSAIADRLESGDDDVILSGKKSPGKCFPEQCPDSLPRPLLRKTLSPSKGLPSFVEDTSPLPLETVLQPPPNPPFSDRHFFTPFSARVPAPSIPPPHPFPQWTPHTPSPT